MIDKSPDILLIPRAVGMSDEGSRIVNSLGLLQELEKEMLPVDAVHFMTKDAEPGFCVDTGTTVNGFQIFLSICPSYYSII